MYLLEQRESYVCEFSFFVEVKCLRIPLKEVYVRQPIKSEPRTKRNDVYLYEGNRTTVLKGEYYFIQDYHMKNYIGSVEMKKSDNVQYQHYDVSIISQTTLDLAQLLTSRTERLFYFSYMLIRWLG